MNLHTPSMQAGSLPRTDHSPDRAVYLKVCEVLDTRRIHMIISVQGSQIFYLALPSSDLTSSPDSRTPLAAALPTHPQHKGDACYLLPLGADAIVVIRRGTTLRLLHNAADVVADAIAAEELPVVDVTELTPWPFTTPGSKARNQGDRLSAQLQKVAMIWGLGVSVLGAGLAVANGLAFRDTAQVESVAGLLQQVQLGQPFVRDVAEVQRLASVATRAGGWIESYSLDKGAVTFDVRLPTWVAPDVIASLGPGITTELDAASGMIAVRKVGSPANKKEQ